MWLSKISPLPLQENNKQYIFILAQINIVGINEKHTKPSVITQQDCIRQCPEKNEVVRKLSLLKQKTRRKTKQTGTA